MNTVTYTVAQCSEFHIMGEYHDDIKTLKEAVQLLQKDRGFLLKITIFLQNWIR